MKKYSILGFLLCIFVYNYSCSDENSNESITDAIYTDAKYATDVISIIDIEGLNPDTQDSDILDLGFDVENDSLVTTDISNEEDTDIRDVPDILDIQFVDTATDNLGYDTTYDVIYDVVFEDIIDSGTTDITFLPPQINELMITPNFSDTELGQYIEIHNPNNFKVDINGYKLKTDSIEFIISNSECETIIDEYSYIVVGATKDPSKNSYAKVRCEWKDKFTLTNANYVELIRFDNTSVDKIDLTLLPKKKGSSLERKGNKFELSPALITFLEETGYYNGDRGSPNKTNYELKQKGILFESTTQKDRIERENSVHRYAVDLAEGDIVAFYADVDRINGDLKLFAALLDSDGNFLTPDRYISDISFDFFIYHFIKETKRYYFQIQPDYFYQFNPANFEVTYFRADGIRVDKRQIELSIGEKYQLTTYATFSQNKDLEDIMIEKTLLDYSSNDPYIADVSKDGIITAKNIGSVLISVNYFYKDGRALNTNVRVNVYNQPSNETCDTAIDATNGLSIYASTIGANDDYNPEECVFSLFSGGDIVYYVDAEPNDTYEVLVVPYGSFDPMIYVYDDCSKKECLFGTVLNGAGDPEKLIFKNDTFSKKRFYVVIDGEAGDEGSFQLTITKK